jgi:hypothetical protein
MMRGNPAPISPVPDIEPARPGGIRTVTDEDDMQAMREGVESGLLSGSEADLNRSLPPSRRGTGRDRDRR